VSRKIAYKNAIYDDNGVGWALGGGELKGMRQFVGSRSALPTKVQIKARRKNRYSTDSESPNFVNLKSQCGFYLADKINQHETSSTQMNDKDIIIEDLTALLVERDIEKDGKLALKQKEKVKDELGRSPDYGDTYIMRSWFDLFDQVVTDDPEEEHRVSNFYDKLRQSKRGTQKGVRAGLR